MQQTTSVRFAHKTQFAPARGLTWRSIGARSTGRRFQSGAVGHARLPSLWPPFAPGQPRAASGNRTAHRRGSLPSRAARSLVPCVCQVRFRPPHRCNVFRARSGRQEPLCPVKGEFASLKCKGAAPCPRTNESSTPCLRPGREPGPPTSRDSAPARTQDRRRVAKTRFPRHTG
jgi:hypothetical protein